LADLNEVQLLVCEGFCGGILVFGVFALFLAIYGRVCRLTALS
jgi:hypothetical protein